MKSSENISNFLKFCRETCSDYKMHLEDINKCEMETQDILHQLELGSYKERSKFATALARTRKRRRISKDFVDVNRVLVEYMTTSEFVKVQRQLEQILGTCRKQEDYIDGCRSYRSKIRNDLTINHVGDKTNE